MNLIKQAKTDCEALIERKYNLALSGLISMEEWNRYAVMQREACQDYIKSLQKPVEWLDHMAQ
jgi:hypothetical protein